MGKHWVYILKSRDHEGDLALYVGETVRLYSRLNEHLSGRGGVNSKILCESGNIELVGLYNVFQNDAFENHHDDVISKLSKQINDPFSWTFQFKRWQEQKDDNYDFLMIENLITEMCIHLKKETWVDVKGGKYTKDACYKNAKIPSRDYRPVCKCGYPAEVFLSKTNEIWFKCSNANASWVKFVHPYFYVPEPCDFFQKYMNDHEFRMRHKID